MVVYSGGRLNGRMDRMVVPSAFEIKTGEDEQGGFCIRTRSRKITFINLLDRLIKIRGRITNKEVKQVLNERERKTKIATTTLRHRSWRVTIA